MHSEYAITVEIEGRIEVLIPSNRVMHSESLRHLRETVLHQVLIPSNRVMHSEVHLGWLHSERLLLVLIPSNRVMHSEAISGERTPSSPPWS